MILYIYCYMSWTYDETMSAYNFNPDLCLQVFLGIAEEIPSGFRYGNVIALFFVEILCNGSSDFILHLHLGSGLFWQIVCQCKGMSNLPFCLAKIEIRFWISALYVFLNNHIAPVPAWFKFSNTSDSVMSQVSIVFRFTSTGTTSNLNYLAINIFTHTKTRIKMHLVYPITDSQF